MTITPSSHALADEERDLITIPEAAARWFREQHVDTVRRWARRGELPGAIQVGGRWFVSVPKAERILHGEQAGGDAA